MKAGYSPWGTIDGKVLPRQIVDSFDRGEQAPVPVLAGFNSGERPRTSVKLRQRRSEQEGS